MIPDNSKGLADFPKLLDEARGGSAEALGRLLMHFRDYLLLLADQGLEPGLQGKVGPSDVVQETFLEAQRDFRQFHGLREDELLAWLQRILANNLTNVGRRYRGTQKRALGREVPFAAGPDGDRPAGDLPLNTPLPGS